MHTFLCKKCNVEFENKRKRTFCSKGCATSYRQSFEDLNFMNDTYDFRSYIIGMIFGDGCLSHQEGKKERITIALKDKHEIDYIRERISPQRKLYIRIREPENHSTMYSIVNTNKEAIQSLKELGLTARKSKTAEIPNLKGIKTSSFVRGYFDSNGSLFKNVVSGHIYYHISITTGSVNFAEQLTQLLNSEGFNTKLNKDKRHDAWYVKIYAKDDVLRFCKWMYEKSEFHLKRKKDLYDDIV